MDVGLGEDERQNTINFLILSFNFLTNPLSVGEQIWMTSFVGSLHNSLSWWL